MQVQKLDHIALYMGDRDAAAGFLTTYLGFHVVDHTERYTLVGAGGRLGKLTLFDTPQGTTSSPGEIERIKPYAWPTQKPLQRDSPATPAPNPTTEVTPSLALKGSPSPWSLAKGSSPTTTSEASSCARDHLRSLRALSSRWASPRGTRLPP